MEDQVALLLPFIQETSTRVSAVRSIGSIEISCRMQLCSQKKNRKSIFEIDFDYKVMKSILKSIIIDFCRVFY